MSLSKPLPDGFDWRPLPPIQPGEQAPLELTFQGMRVMYLSPINGAWLLETVFGNGPDAAKAQLFSAREKAVGAMYRWSSTRQGAVRRMAGAPQNPIPSDACLVAPLATHAA